MPPEVVPAGRLAFEAAAPPSRHCDSRRMGGAKRYHPSYDNCEIVARHAPRRRGIQYAAAYRFNHWRLWNTGSPAFAGDDSREMTQLHDLAARFARGLLANFLNPRV